jgi:hypothetical protein
MTLQLVVLSLAPHWALWQVLQLDQRRDMWGQARQLAPVLVWLQAVLWEVGMPAPPVARCKRDMTPFMRSA